RRRDRGPPRDGKPAARPEGSRRVERVSVASASASDRPRARNIEQMAITQRPLAVRRDLIRIFGEDRLVAVIRTTSPEIARKAAQAMSEAGVRLVEITLTVPDAFEMIEELALDDAFTGRGSVAGA